MQITWSEKQRLHKIHLMLRDKTHEYLAEHEIFVCRKCRGTGLCISWSNHPGASYVHVDLEDFCDTCTGIGYIINHETYDLGEGHYMCSECLGRGCKHCNNIGIVDWIANAMRKDK